MTDPPKIFPLGAGAVTVDFGNEISLELNQKAIALAEHLRHHPFPGFIEAAPAYSSVSIFYDVVEVRRTFPRHRTTLEAMRIFLESAIAAVPEDSTVRPRHVEIPVDFSADVALDLDAAARRTGLTPSSLIEIFLSRTYRVYMLGFLPGFAYMGEVDPRIALPRHTSPRLKVPKGSVGIAGTQTGVYPLESPGGWQIIGRTRFEMFTPNDEPPCPLRAGDEVQFVRMD